MQQAFIARVASSPWLRSSAVALSLGLLAAMAQAQTFRFAFTQHDTEFVRTEQGEPIDLITNNTGTTSASSVTAWEKIPPFTNDPNRSMRSDARTDWGVNGVRASVVNVPSDRDTTGSYGAYALSIWSDALSVKSGAPIGVLDLSARLDGTLNGSEADVTYAVMYRDRPFSPAELQNWLDDEISYGENGELRAPTGASLAVGLWQIGGNAADTYRALVPYALNETVYVASVLEVGALGPTSTADFYNSAYFGIRAPTGAELTAASGFTYATSVPEASTLSMAVLGLMALGAWRLRRLS